MELFQPYFLYFQIVIEENGDIVRSEDGNICLQQLADGRLYFVAPSKDILEMFQLNQTTPSPPKVEPSTSTPSSSTINIPRTKWPKKAIDLLIEIRIELDKEFKNTKTKQDVTWKTLSEEMKKRGFDFTSTQCNDKWRYLKQRYTSKKDNMGSRGTGEAPVYFEHFEMLDAFLGKKPNIIPVAVASSLKGDRVPLSMDNALNDDNGHDEPKSKKRKFMDTLSTSVKKNKTPISVIEEMNTSARDREKNRERRHQEEMQVRNRAIDIFSSKMDVLFSKLDKI
ncbi:unnamed protein product [Brassicogethes aeneus]|uniref:Myb/SANT-like DNA-binding domain-containing protein n=1 Tax=Brassicogethes aeneus TaxID=1431903 RepID=A0A9P0BJY2_BRAAE|nr:unnamed protein product [Brassicogethes aeneus]